ncbi:transglutaminase-like domain-containing protein [Antarcticirhabdus aurantiaca]|uniref:Transglutaminase family protein n=1 Tax=Antarcticirhabdus aurantiaca TaxID=2606717 RepID=A0ACD4NU16_9HYPH|nr:transglutaminase family protein [Antarcticirhabdus aurantiaca]WAJ30323.1 transglutaminase family protein [Jeongeuplla avenae]
MRFKVGCRLTYDAKVDSGFVFNIQAAHCENQTVLEEKLVVEPDVPLETYVMPESGNRYIRFQAPKGAVSVTYDAVVEHTPERRDPKSVSAIDLKTLPFPVLPHLYPSRFCESDRLQRAALSDFGDLPPSHERVTAICNWIYERIEYLRGSSDAHTSALVTLVDRAGVCRDFAHLGIALCRSLGIPARYVSAYAWKLDPPDFHAVFEAYLGGRWYLFDGTRQAALDGLVRIGIGRDASEVAFADFVGQVEPTDMTVFCEAVEEPADDQPTTDAISLSES